MSTITTQNWDGVTAPSATITGWHLDSGLAAETGTHVSGPNGIGSAPVGFLFATWQTQDGNSGDVAASASFYLDTSNSGDTAFGVCVRGSSSTLDSTSTSWYAAEVESDRSFAGTWQIRILKLVSGTSTTVASLTGLTAGTPDGAWYRLSLTANGSSLSASLVRASDGYYLSTGGTFAATPANCLTGTNTGITGAGYSGLYAHGIGFNSNSVYTDDFELDTVVPTTLVKSNSGAPTVLALLTPTSGVIAAYWPRTAGSQPRPTAVHIQAGTPGSTSLESLTSDAGTAGPQAVNGTCASGQAVVPMTATAGMVVGQTVFLLAGTDGSGSIGGSETGVIASVITDTSITLTANLANAQTGSYVYPNVTVSTFSSPLSPTNPLFLVFDFPSLDPGYLGLDADSNGYSFGGL